MWLARGTQMHTKIFGLAGMALGLALTCPAPASAGTVTLPIPGTCGIAGGNNCLVFDDFTVYSLALLNYQAGSGDVNGNDPYAVSTNGTALQNALVVGTGVSGQGSINTDQIGGGLVDNAYQTPNSSGGLTNFATNTTVGADNSTQGAQGGSIPNNSINTWDVSISALNTYLNGGKLTFFFNLNQTNSNVSTYLDNPEDTLGWLAVTLRNNDGSVSKTFYLDGDACTGGLGSPLCDPTQSWGDLAGQTNANNNILTDQALNHDDWAYIHGQICVGNSGSTFGAVLGFGSCQSNGIPSSVGDTINQNLGADLAAFALYSQTLQDALNSGLYTVMSVDFRMAAEDNGYEQLLIYSSTGIPQLVPEPLTITLF